MGKIYQTLDKTVNPCAGQDIANASMEEPEQYPEQPTRVKYVFDDLPLFCDVDSTSADYAGALGGTLLRMKRTGADPLEEIVYAQQYFDARRLELAWTAETAIYRTGRYWIKRIWRRLGAA